MLEGRSRRWAPSERATGESRINLAGYCLAHPARAMLAGWRQTRRTRGVVTFLASLLDFSIPGELGVFIDERRWRISSAA